MTFSLTWSFSLPHRDLTPSLISYDGVSRSYPSREKTARFLTADVEELIRECSAEKERLSVELKDKLKQLTDADISIKKSSQVYNSPVTLYNVSD